MVQAGRADGIISNMSVTIEGRLHAFHSVCSIQNVSFVASKASLSKFAGKVLSLGLLLQATIPGQTMVMITT